MENKKKDKLLRAYYGYKPSATLQLWVVLKWRLAQLFRRRSK